MNFKEFMVENTECEKDIAKTLKKLPEKIRKLVAGYKFKFQNGNTLKGDSGHIGIINPNEKTLIIAAPWRYGREFCFLHEIGHLLWAILDNETKQQWMEIVKKHPCKEEDKQPAEELFAMSFSQQLAYNPVKKFCIPAWNAFMKQFAK